MSRTTAFYAAYRPYGLTALNTNGLRADKLWVFPTRGERDAWVAKVPSLREPLAATSNEIRAARRFEGRMGYSIMVRPGDE